MLSRAALTVPRRAAAKFVLATEIDGKLVKANMDWAEVQATRVSGILMLAASHPYFVYFS